MLATLQKSSIHGTVQAYLQVLISVLINEMKLYVQVSEAFV